MRARGRDVSAFGCVPSAAGALGHTCSVVVFAQVATLINVLMIKVSDNTKRFKCQNVPIRSISHLQIHTYYCLHTIHTITGEYVPA